MKKFARSLVLGLCAAALCCSSALAAETLRIGGGSSPMENVFKRIKEPFQQKTGIVLELVENGAVDAYTGLLSGQLDVASAGIGSLRQWQALVSKAGADAATQERLSWHIVGTDLITAYTNKNVTVPKLTRDQVRDIFTGKIANWKEVGGPDAPIVVVLGTKVPGLMNEFQKVVLNDAAYTQTAEYGDTVSGMMEKVVATPNSVAIGTAIQAEDSRINVIDYPAPQRNISILWKVNSPKRESIQTLYEYLGTAEAKQFTLSGTHEHDGSRHSHNAPAAQQ